MKKLSYSSILIGLMTFGLLGFSGYHVFVRLGIMSENQLVYFFMLFGGLFGIYLGYQSPITTELMSFGITLLIAVQAIWDTAYDIQGGFQEARVLTGLIAIAIFTTNTFTGKFRKGTARTQLRKLIGQG